MEKVYDLTNETEYYSSLCYLYFKLTHVYDGVIFTNNSDPLDCHELLRFAIHHAKIGENVYLVGFPRQVKVLDRPDNLFFLERWSDFMDISDLDHALALVISNRNGNDYRQVHETFKHINRNYKSFISITFQN